MPSHRGLTATKNQSLASVPSRHHRIFYSKKNFLADGGFSSK
jgi:hypothetical protein